MSHVPAFKECNLVGILGCRQRPVSCVVNANTEVEDEKRVCSFRLEESEKEGQDSELSFEG